MILLDTDHLSILGRDTGEAFSIGRRLAGLPDDAAATTVITYEEQMRGWMAYIAAAMGPEQEIQAYSRLRDLIDKYRIIRVVDYDAKSAAIFQQLVDQRIRIGTMDLKIAAIALANRALLSTRNGRDFGRIPGLRIEDWTV
jgi:tRNA(fMet)-specific endonuclease VapC